MSTARTYPPTNRGKSKLPDPKHDKSHPTRNGHLGKTFGGYLGKKIGRFAGKHLGKYTGVHAYGGGQIGQEVGETIGGGLIPFKKGGRVIKNRRRKYVR
jgi:hypothetical protein